MLRLFTPFIFTYIVLSQINVWEDILTYRNLYESTERKQAEFAIQTAFFNNYESSYSHYLEVSPITSIQISDNVTAYFKHNIISDDNYFQLDSISKPFYKYKKYIGLKSYTEEAYINYSFSFGSIKLGRFFDIIGQSELNGLILDNHDYHDGYRIELRYKDLLFTNRYFALSPVRQNTSINRHFHQHGLKWNISKKWSIEIHETSIYDGQNLNPRFAFINPFTVYHANQLNDGINSNTNWSILVNYNKKRTHLWFELLVDDYQTDSDATDLSDQEPNEIAFQIGGKYGLKNHNFLIDFTVVRNRVYNDPVSMFSKYTDHNQVIGFTEGNNLIQFNFIYQNRINKNLLVSYHLKGLNRGDEGLWADFNRDYLLEKGYEEPIPYGKIESELINSIIVNYKLSSDFLGELTTTVSESGDFGINLKILKYTLF